MKFVLAMLAIMSILTAVNQVISSHGPALGFAQPGRYCYIGELTWKADGYVTTNLIRVVFKDGDKRKVKKGEEVLYSFIDVDLGEDITPRMEHFRGGSLAQKNEVSQSLVRR